MSMHVSRNILGISVIAAVILWVFPISSLRAAPEVNCDTPGTTCLENPLNPSGTREITTVPEFIGRIVKGILGLVGSGALIMFVWGGFKFISAAGNAKKIEEAKETITWAVFGLLMVFFAFAMTKFIVTALKASGS